MRCVLRRHLRREEGWKKGVRVDGRLKKKKKTNKGRIKIEKRGEDRPEQLMEIGCSTSASHE